MIFADVESAEEQHLSSGDPREVAQPVSILARVHAVRICLSPCPRDPHFFPILANECDTLSVLKRRRFAGMTGESPEQPVKDGDGPDSLCGALGIDAAHDEVGPIGEPGQI